MRAYPSVSLLPDSAGAAVASVTRGLISVSREPAILRAAGVEPEGLSHYGSGPNDPARPSYAMFKAIATLSRLTQPPVGDGWATPTDLAFAKLSPYYT